MTNSDRFAYFSKSNDDVSKSAGSVSRRPGSKVIPETKAPRSLKRTLYFDILELVDLLSVPVLLFVVSQVTLYTVQQSHNRRFYHQTGNDFGNKGKGKYPRQSNRRAISGWRPIPHVRLGDSTFPITPRFTKAT